MSLTSLINRPCQILRRAAAGTDIYGNTEQSDYVTATVCEIQQRRRDEKDGAGELSDSEWVGFFLPGDWTYDKQTVVVKATGGTFTLTWNGDTTDPIAFNAPAPDVEDAIEAATGIPGNDLTSTGSIAGDTRTFTFTFFGAEAYAAELSIDGSGLTGDVQATVVPADRFFADTGDAVKVPGMGTFEFTGAPWLARNPRTQEITHVEASLRKTSGAGDVT